MESVRRRQTGEKGKRRKGYGDRKRDRKREIMNREMQGEVKSEQLF